MHRVMPRLRHYGSRSITEGWAGLASWFVMASEPGGARSDGTQPEAVGRVRVVYADDGATPLERHEVTGTATT